MSLVVLVLWLTAAVGACGQSPSSPTAKPSAFKTISARTLSSYSLAVTIAAAHGVTTQSAALKAARNEYPMLVVKETVFGSLVDSGIRIASRAWMFSANPDSVGVSSKDFDWCLVAVDADTMQVVDMVAGNNANDG